MTVYERIDQAITCDKACGHTMELDTCFKHEVQKVKQLIIDILADASPEYRTDTRGVTQNPNNASNHTKKAQGYNECIDDFTDNLIDILDN